MIENNALIADFMGYEKELAYTMTNTSKHDKWLTPYEVRWMAASWMKFHTSWDWLMPVVEKIESLTTEDGRGMVNYVVSLDKNYGVVSVGGEESVVEYQGDNWFETVYNTMLLFIQWYNTQKQSV